jgi:hypothetical protein
VSEKKAHFTPHPLCIEDAKIRLLQWEKQGVDSLSQYLIDSPNPRWAASHLVRVISAGLAKVDLKASMTLAELANELASRGPVACKVQDADREVPIESQSQSVECDATEGSS